MNAASSSTRTQSPIELRVPGSESYLRMIRTVAGQVAHANGFSYNGIEDFALAVDEAAVILLGYAPSALEVSITQVAEPNSSVSVELVARDATGDWPPADLHTDTRWLILSTVCERVWVVDGGSHGIGLAQTTR